VTVMALLPGGMGKKVSPVHKSKERMRNVSPQTKQHKKESGRSFGASSYPDIKDLGIVEGEAVAIAPTKPGVGDG